MTLGCTRNLFRLALTVIVLTFIQPSAAQAQKPKQEPKLEIFVFATTIQLRSELVSSERAVDPCRFLLMSVGVSEAPLDFARSPDWESSSTGLGLGSLRWMRMERGWPY